MYIMYTYALTECVRILLTTQYTIHYSIHYTVYPTYLHITITKCKAFHLLNIVVVKMPENKARLHFVRQLFLGFAS